MVALVAAVVSVHEYMGRVRQSRQQAAQVAVSALRLVQVAFTHPPVVVPRRVHRAQVHKCKVRFALSDVGNGDISHLVIPFVGHGAVAIPGKFQHFRAAEVAQRLPVVDRRTVLAVLLRLLDQPRQRARHRLPGVGGDAVPAGGRAVKDGHVAWQRDAGHDRAGGECPCPAPAHCLQGRAVGCVNSVRAQAIDHDEDHRRIRFHMRSLIGMWLSSD